MNHYKITKDFTKDDMRVLIESDLKKDIHMHTVYSDGALTPKEVIDMRVAEGFELLAITDHDGIGGSVAVREYAESLGINFISGIEFDSEDGLGKDIHMLGYGFDPDNETLKKALEGVLQERRNRNIKFMETLNKRGYGITEEEVWAINEGRFVGKPTFATVLRNKGIVKGKDEAFNTIFREPDIRSIKKKTLPTKEVVDVIHEAGGLAVLAHPMEQRRLNETFEEFEPRLYWILDRILAYGIDGLECHHPSADPYQQELLVAYAKEHGLMITTGSDFHTLYDKRDFKRYHRP